METIHIEHNGHSHDIPVDVDTVLGRDLAKLNYYYQHNESHCNELIETMEDLKANNYNAPVECLEKSIELFKQANELVHQAIHAAQEV